MLFVYVVVKQFQEYTEPGSGEDGTPQRRSEDEESVLLPLGDNTLTHNLGIPVVVVCTKVHTHSLTAGLCVEIYFTCLLYVILKLVNPM